MAMYEWNEATQKMIDWIEEHLNENKTLLEMSEQIGYSPYYCSMKFHEIVGMTIRSYVSGRKLANAVLQIRDTEKRILDIAIENGYSSQEALTRAFQSTFGCTPACYRKNPKPMPISNAKVVFFPEQYNKLYGNQGGIDMGKTCLTDAKVRMEYIPAHKYIGIWDAEATCYYDFWKHHDCDEICGIIESMRNVSSPVVGCHMAGWRHKNGKLEYFYGLGVASNYDGPVPEGFEIREFPASYYMVFFHPTFDYLKDCGEVMSRVENLAWNYKVEELGFEDTKQRYQWNEEECQCYQRHYPEVLGYEVLRPVKLM